MNIRERNSAEAEQIRVYQDKPLCNLFSFIDEEACSQMCFRTSLHKQLPYTADSDICL